ncbi:dienelactone hydrolase family protein [Nocardia africana]|uniref:Dienelactone hydrolase family n=1 Tax=Nocardia africana TaxID=134964 RepID=A0A378X447_9NOCA|nr:dienelactone hydrolase family protein [Nocardia africana]MCC3317444.1 dienelactone hydrolase family protein [Nocardia africana]SUA48198.1 Dienelactone hydrolase family [Nocardia africana]
MADDPLIDFTRESFTHAGISHPIFRSGTGPAVIVMTEVPGITPKVAEFARRVRDLGLTAVLPDMFGTAGRDPGPAGHGLLRSATYQVGTIARLCIGQEFSMLAGPRNSPITTWLRALGAAEHRRCGGPGIGAVGMCLTGGFALAMAADDRLLAPVLSQPATPVPLTRRHRRGIGIETADLARIRQRCAQGLGVVGLRFRGDRLVPEERFASLRRQLGPAFVAVELDPESANPDAPMRPHSVLTEHLVDTPGHPTRQALDLVLEHLRTRLLDPHADRPALHES